MSTRMLKLGGLAFIALLAVTGIVIAAMSGMGSRAAAQPGPSLPVWPEFTMVYETDGAAVSVGTGPAEVTREVHRLEYQSATQWTDTVIEAPTIETRVGSFSMVGSYQTLDGDTYTEYNAYDQSPEETTVPENTTMVPGRVMPPFPIKESGVELTATTTTAKVCFQDQCGENAEGRLYTKANGVEIVFVDDARGIPLRVDDAFVVKEIRIDDTKQEIRQ